MLLQERRSRTGEPLYEARCRSQLACNVPRQRLLFHIHLLCLGSFSFLELYVLRVYLGIADQDWLAGSHLGWFYAAVIGLASVAIFYCLVFISTTSFSRDCIYEKGIMTFNHNLLDHLRGHTFHKFNRIRRVEYGHSTTRDGGQEEFVRIYEGRGRKQAAILYSTSYEDDYWSLLLLVLRERSPGATWQKVSQPYLESGQSFTNNGLRTRKYELS